MSDYESRIKKVQEYLREHSLDAFLVLSRTNRQYLSGFTGSAGYLLVTPKSAKLFVDERYTIRAKKESGLSVHNPLQLPQIVLTLPPSPGEERVPKGGEVETFPPHPASGHLLPSGRRKKSNGSDLRGRVPPLGLRGGKGELRVGIEDTIRLVQHQNLKKMLPGVKWRITSGAVEELRAVKEADELRLIKKGSKIIDGAFLHLKKVLKRKLTKGVTEIELAYELEKFGKKKGAEALAFDPIVAFGANAASPHHFSSSKKIGRNNFLLLDFGMKVREYHTDFTRTLFIGKPTKKHEQVYNIVLEAQRRAIEKVRAGENASAVDKAARKYIEKAGYKDNYTHNGGHGVGLEIHELPNFAPNSDDVLRENMVVTVEPGIYLEKKFGVRIEDMVVVGKRSKVLSKVPKDFKNMII